MWCISVAQQHKWRALDSALHTAHTVYTVHNRAHRAHAHTHTHTHTARTHTQHAQSTHKAWLFSPKSSTHVPKGDHVGEAVQNRRRGGAPQVQGAHPIHCEDGRDGDQAKPHDDGDGRRCHAAQHGDGL